MAPADDDISIEEKRVYAGTAGRTDAYVATESGVVRVALSADKVGTFDMISRDAARDVAVRPGGDDAPDLVGVATPDGLFVSPISDELAFETVETGAAVAVGARGDSFVVAGENGEIDRVEFGHAETDDRGSESFGSGDGSSATVTRIGWVSDPTAIDSPLVAAADGVHRITESDASDIVLPPGARPRRGADWRVARRSRTTLHGVSHLDSQLARRCRGTTTRLYVATRHPRSCLWSPGNRGTR